MDDALRNCRAARSPENLIHECHLYAVNNAVVYPGREYELPKLKVDFGSFSLREDYFFYGPQRSKGVIVWSHGTAHDCVEARGTAAWSFITRFNLDGWDVLRFDRDPCFDTMPRALSQIATSILQLRDVGYRRIVLAGQSRGAWQSLELLSVPGIAQYVSAIIAVSPARHGTKFTYVTEQGWADWAFLIDHLDAPRVAIALIFFPQDEFIPDARKRAAYGAAALAQKGNPYMIVYEEEGGITGHAGGGNARFTEKYSLCLTQFVNSGGRDRLCGTTGLPAGR